MVMTNTTPGITLI